MRVQCSRLWILRSTEFDEFRKDAWIGQLADRWVHLLECSVVGPVQDVRKVRSCQGPWMLRYVICWKNFAIFGESLSQAVVPPTRLISESHSSLQPELQQAHELLCQKQLVTYYIGVDRRSLLLVGRIRGRLFCYRSGNEGELVRHLVTRVRFLLSLFQGMLLFVKAPEQGREWQQWRAKYKNRTLVLVVIRCTSALERHS